MKSFIKRKATGFTIIEVLIVLAIAGLILSIVFIAVPQLQRNARDNKRQSVANRLSTELGSYAANNQGTFPWVGVSGSWADCSAVPPTVPQSCYDWYHRYIDTKVNISDPKDGSNTVIKFSNTSTLEPWAVGHAWITVGGTCSGDTPTGGGGTASSKQYALTIALERSDTYYCVDNG